MKFKVEIIFVGLILSSQLLAAEFRGHIVTLATGPNLGSTILVKVENHSADAAWSTDCSTDSYWSYKFDSSAEGGNEAYSLLLAAYLAEKDVVILGTGTCASGIGSDVQDLRYTRF